MPSKPKPDLGLFAQRIFVFVVGCFGLIWAVSSFARGATVEEFRNVQDRLLQFETFNQAAATRMLESPASSYIGACDYHAQRALLLLEVPLADAALRSGAVRDFDRHMQSIEQRSKQVLACAPRDPLIWILLFGTDVEYGRLDGHSFDLLATSYEISPNEAWIAMRRVTVAIPVVLAAPEPMRQTILTEFQQLVRHRFVEIPARSYLSAPASVRALLQSRIDELDPQSRKSFSEALEKLRS